nr:DegT/DnrJ/EryC1/StrS family aminotransferase [Micromonospora sp. DSM 115978]
MRSSPVMAEKPAIVRGEQRAIPVDPASSLLGQPERAAMLAAFDAAAARGGFEGDEVARFERLLATTVGAAEAVAVSSATAGLQFLLMGHGVGPGDEVLVPAHTFPASAHAVVHTGAEPVFVDVEPDTLCLDPGRIEESLTARTKAIVVVHIGGKPARMDEIMAIAGGHGLVVVNDAAQAHGATLAGRHVATIGAGGVYSFSPKLMTSFRGGAIVTDDRALADRCRELRFHGFSPLRTSADKQRPGGHRFEHQVPGYSAALSAIQAAMLIPQLEQLADRVRVRHANALRLADGLAATGGFRPLLGSPDGLGNFYMLETFYDPMGFGGLTRAEAAEALLWEGVPVSPVAVAHMLAPENPSLRHYRSMPLPVATAARDEVLVFGHPLQSLILGGDAAHIDDVVDRVRLVRANTDRIAAFLRGCTGS